MVCRSSGARTPWRLHGQKSGIHALEASSVAPPKRQPDFHTPTFSVPVFNLLPSELCVITRRNAYHTGDEGSFKES